MSRDEYLTLRRQGVDGTQLSILLYNYCLHRGKSEEDAERLREVAATIPMMFTDWYSYAVEYLDMEFEVSILSKNNNIISIF